MKKIIQGCGHCKKLAPTYEELAQKLKHIDSLVIAKINGAAYNLK